MKADDRCKTTYQWFICTAIDVGYLFLNSDRVMKSLIIYKGINTSFYIINTVSYKSMLLPLLLHRYLHNFLYNKYL